MDGKKIELKKKKKKKIESKLASAAITWGITLVLIVLLFLTFRHYFFGGRITNYVSNKEMIAVLFLGKDELVNNEKTDTMIIGIYSPAAKRFGMLAIPRDLKVEVNEKMGAKTVKINSIAAKYGIKKLFGIIKNITGLDLDFYVSMEIGDIIKIVDLTGGVDIYVDRPMHYIDKAANLYIELPRGIIKCDGLKAMQYIRYRADERGDMGRIERQYEFILNLIKKAVIQNNLTSNLKLLKIIFKNIDTNLNFNDIINLIKYSSTADFNNLEMWKVPGSFTTSYGVDYVEPDIGKTKNMIRDLMNKLSYVKTDFIPQEIKVQVLNGSGKPGIAKHIRDRLVRNGFNVIEFGNSELQDYENTLILNRTGNMKKALKVAEILKCKNVYPKIDKFIMIDVTVIVGKDYKKYY